ncbi:MAG: ribonuclease Z [Candidatus Altiarchaeota archaeon]
MEIVFLGTSGCIPTETRNLASVLIRYLGEPYLFDCGEGTQRQMRFAKINFMKIDHIFLTHLHADHFLGLGGMIQSMDFLERNRPLHIYGPIGTERTINGLVNLGTFKLESFEIKVKEVEEGLVYDGGNFTVSCAPTVHTRGSVAYCFEEKPHRRFLKKKALSLGIPEGRLFSRLQDGHEVKVGDKVFKPDDVLSNPMQGRKVVYTGDTKASDSVIRLAEAADILIHEATFAEDDVDNTRDAFHSTTKQAALVAKRANVDALYLIHFSQRYTESDKLEEEAREIFENSYVAEDLMTVKLKKHW